jgi:glycosyltransferase involved in cell wall biosynthesis
MPERRFNPCAVIPVYDHEHAIGIVLAAVRAHGLHVFLVDDGCSDSCARVLEELAQGPQVTLLRHPHNLGKGAAVCTGLRAARERGFSHALQIDADGQHTLSDVPQFIDAARTHPAAVVCGRPIFDATIPRSRYYGRYLTHWMVWLETLSFDIVDSMCGFRVYPLAQVLALIEQESVGSRMDFDSEILVRLHWAGISMRWLGTRVSYPLDGLSHFRMVLDNALLAGLHVRLTLGMLARLPFLLARKVASNRTRQVGGDQVTEPRDEVTE